MNKFFKIISFLVLIYGCSYKPILSNQKYNFSFNKIDTKGEKSINGFIKSNLINKSTGEEKFDILLNTTKNKKIISSDQRGDPLVFELTITLNYEVKKNNKNLISETIKKKISYNNIKDKFELSKYEENILKNISANISDEILIGLTKFME
ncbi:hypothetical protein OA070_00740 [Candidatus Pelagibacter sp.]|nr:hypothetical protein [Candidatus Pelagibacter sp.]